MEATEEEASLLQDYDREQEDNTQTEEKCVLSMEENNPEPKNLSLMRQFRSKVHVTEEIWMVALRTQPISWRFAYAYTQHPGAAIILCWLFTGVITSIVEFFEYGIGRQIYKKSQKSQMTTEVSNDSSRHDEGMEEKKAVPCLTSTYPQLSGIGLVGAIFNLMIGTYFVIFVSWSFMYFTRYFTKWTECDIDEFKNTTSICTVIGENGYYFWDTVVKKSNNGDSWNLPLTVSMLIIYFVVYLITTIDIRPHRFIQRFIWMSTLVVLLVCTFRAFSLPGAWSGLKHLVTDFEMSSLKDIKLWLIVTFQQYSAFCILFTRPVVVSDAPKPCTQRKRFVFAYPMFCTFLALWVYAVVFSAFGHVWFTCESSQNLVMDDIDNGSLRLVNSTVCNITKIIKMAGMGAPLVSISVIVASFDGGTFMGMVVFGSLLGYGIFYLTYTIRLASSVLKGICSARLSSHVPGIVCGVCFLCSLCFIGDAGVYRLQYADTVTMPLILIFLIGYINIFFGWNFETLSLLDGFRIYPNVRKWMVFLYKYLIPPLLVTLVGIVVMHFEKFKHEVVSLKEATVNIIEDPVNWHVFTVIIIVIFAFLVELFRWLKIELYPVTRVDTSTLPTPEPSTRIMEQVVQLQREGSTHVQNEPANIMIGDHCTMNVFNQVDTFDR